MGSNNSLSVSAALYNLRSSYNRSNKEAGHMEGTRFYDARSTELTNRKPEAAAPGTGAETDIVGV